jgi:hypothetical protein
MNRIGFSTGALAKGDFRAGVRIERRLGASVIELSALRDHELRPLLESIGSLPLDGFQYISFHAPSRLGQLKEQALILALMQLPSSWPIIVHPDIIEDHSRWRILGSRLCIENMDQRKPVGRTVPELERVYDLLPEASLCFDIGHARQVDPTMGIAAGILRKFKNRLTQIHMSEVDSQGSHISMSFSALYAFRRVASLIPENCPIILESVVSEAGAIREIAKARFVLDSFAEYDSLKKLGRSGLTELDSDLLATT